MNLHSCYNSSAGFNHCSGKSKTGFRLNNKGRKCLIRKIDPEPWEQRTIIEELNRLDEMSGVIMH